jgi:hypothetical protein
MGLLVCMCFLSRQYVVVPFVLIALGATIADITPGSDPVPTPFFAQTPRILGVTVCLTVAFYVAARVFAN